MAVAEVNGVRLHYVERGAGPLVVLVHGLACGWRMWRSQLRALSARYRVVAYDQRGHGASAAPPDAAAYSEQILADDLAGLIRALGQERAFVVGLSMGGGAGLDLAMRRPEMVAGLVLADAGAGSDDIGAARRGALVWSGIARERGIEAFAAEMLRSVLLKEYLRAGGARARRHMGLLITQHPAHSIAHILSEVQGRRMSMYRRGFALGRVRVPTLVLCGSRDWSCRKPSRFVAAHIPGAAHVELAKAGHMTPLEDPRGFNRAVAGFLDRLAPAA